MYGMVLARNSKFPEVKSTGLSGLPHLACFTSEDGHYSVTKGAHWLGLGTDSVYKARISVFHIFQIYNKSWNIYINK